MGSDPGLTRGEPGSNCRRVVQYWRTVTLRTESNVSSAKTRMARELKDAKAG